MADNAIIPCPSCDEKCSVATQHLSRRLRCPHCGDEFVPADAGRGGGRKGGGGSRGGGRDDRRGGGRRARSGNNAGLALAGVGALLVVILIVAFVGAKGAGQSGRKRSDDGGDVKVTSVSETAARSDGAKASRASEGPPDHDASIHLGSCPPGSYAVNGTIYNATRSIRLWRDPHELWRGKRVAMIAHQEAVQALGMGTNNKGIPIYKIRGKSKLGGKTVEGYVSAFYIEKDNKAVAEHKFEWVDEDDWELHGISKEDHD